MCVLYGQLCVIVSVAQTGDCCIFRIILKLCRISVQPISPEMNCNILIIHRIHTSGHNSIILQQILVMKTVAVPNSM